MFQRFWAGFALAKGCWRVLCADKKLLLFPVLSAAGCVLLLISFVLPFLFNLNWLMNVSRDDFRLVFRPRLWVYPAAFVYYFCSYFVVVFFNTALTACALMRFNGEEPTLEDGLRAAGRRLPQVLAWALVSATVGVLLKVIESSHERVGKLVSALIGTAWTVITFFVLPVLVVEKVGPVQAVKRSVQILRDSWGEAAGGTSGIGLFLFLLALPAVLLFFVGGFLMVKVGGIFSLLVLGLAVLSFFGVAAVGAALGGIFRTALYQYATIGELPGGFDRAAVEQAFAKK
jgi:hypothetical protein